MYKKREQLVLTDAPSRPSWLFDACCAPRKKAEFVNTLTSEEVVEILKLNQSGVIWVVSLQIVLLALWLLATIVPGFVLYDGTSTFAYTHAAWWLLVEVIVIVIGAVSTYFGMRHHSINKLLERSAYKTDKWNSMYFAILLLGAVSHLVHIISCWMEFAKGDSTLYTKFSWCFWIFVVGLHVELILCLWGITRANAFQTTLQSATSQNLLNMSLVVFKKEEEQQKETFVSTTDPEPTKAQLMTPLLAQALRANTHGYKK